MTGAATNPAADPLTTLATVARALLPPFVAVAVTDPRVDHGPLMPDELASCFGMSSKRRREFTAGRAAIRSAMLSLGRPLHPVPMRADRAPMWPDGLTGSLAHCETACLAVVSRSRQARAFGVDLEPADPLDPGLTAEICDRAELDWLGRQPSGTRGLFARVIFSAKECLYKAQYPVTGRLFGFDMVRVTLDPGAGSFGATFLQDNPPFARGTTLAGKWAVVAGLILTTMCIDA